MVPPESPRIKIFQPFQATFGQLIELTGAQQFGVVLDDISITHLTFGREFTAAVEAKQVASQEAEKAKFLVEKAEQVKTASIISETVRLQSY